MAKIELTDNFLDIMMKMSEGNPGACSALMDMYSGAEKIDPAAVMGGIGAIMSLDTHEIYGSDIYILWNDKCQRDLRKMLMIMRAVQLGYLPESKLQSMAGDQMREIDLTQEEWEAFDKRVCDRLPDFQRAA